MPRFPIILTAFLVSILVTSVVKAQTPDAEALVSCPIVFQPEPPPYGFAKAVLISLWYAKTAAERGNEMAEEIKKADNEFSQVTAMMRTTKISTNDFICAKQVLKPFTTKANSENGRSTAEYLIQIYDQHIDINHRMIEILKKLGTTKESDLMDEISTLEVERGQRWSDLVLPTAMVLLLLVDANRPDEKGGTRWLNITNAQKQALLDWAYQHFPEFKNGTPQDQWSDPAKTAELYLKFLNGHRGLDEGQQQ